MNYTHIINTPTYTPLNYTYTCADISKEQKQKQLARDRMAKRDQYFSQIKTSCYQLYINNGKHYSLRAVK